MIKINFNEYEELKKQNIHYKLSVASIPKNTKGKTRYINNDDYPALKLIAKMRNTTVKELLK